MKAVRLDELGGPEKLHVAEIDDAVAAPGEVLVRITRAALNRRDVFITQGLYPGISLPRTLGSDGVGLVAALGEGVAGPALGTRVVIDPQLDWGNDRRIWSKAQSLLGMPRDGTFAELIAVPAQNVHTAPKHLSDDEAAAMPLAGVTAYRAAFTRGRMTKDDIVLITGVGGGVQTFVLLFAKHVGAKTIVTSGSDAKLERARKMGADACINYRSSEAWHKEVRKAAGGDGPTLIIDSVGGDTFARALDAAAWGARVVTYGGTTGDAKIKMFNVFWKQLDILGSSMGSPEDFKEMLALFETGLRPAVDEVFAIDDVVRAAQRVHANEQFGKVVLAIS